MSEPDPPVDPAVDPPIDIERPNAARMYDYLLGGAHHFAADRELADRVLAVNPDGVRTLRANRSYLGRVVRWCVGQGIDQFLDLGSGVPTVGNVHEVARSEDPDARVAYVDNEPVAVAHAEEILTPVDGVTATRADLREPATVWEAPGVRDLLDVDRPVALLAVAVLHFVPGDLTEVLTPYRERLAPGSVIAISHGSDDHDDAELVARMRASSEQYARSATPTTLRSRAEILALMAGTDLVAPGLVDISAWPTPQGDPVGFYAAVGRLP